jgi:hypothetical protein
MWSIIANLKLASILEQLLNCICFKNAEASNISCIIVEFGAKDANLKSFMMKYSIKLFFFGGKKENKERRRRKHFDVEKFRFS